MAGKQKNVRVGGYVVAIYGFIRVPADDIQSQIARMTAVDEAIKSNDVTTLVGMMAVDMVSQKYVNRMVPKDGPQPSLTKQEAETETKEPEDVKNGGESGKQPEDDPRPAGRRLPR